MILFRQASPGICCSGSIRESCRTCGCSKSPNVRCRSTAPCAQNSGVLTTLYLLHVTQILRASYHQIPKSSIYDGALSEKNLENICLVFSFFPVTEAIHHRTRQFSAWESIDEKPTFYLRSSNWPRASSFIVHLRLNCTCGTYP